MPHLCIEVSSLLKQSANFFNPTIGCCLHEIVVHVLIFRKRQDYGREKNYQDKWT